MPRTTTFEDAPAEKPIVDPKPAAVTKMPAEWAAMKKTPAWLLAATCASKRWAHAHSNALASAEPVTEAEYDAAVLAAS